MQLVFYLYIYISNSVRSLYIVHGWSASPCIELFVFQQFFAEFFIIAPTVKYNNGFLHDIVVGQYRNSKLVRSRVLFPRSSRYPNYIVYIPIRRKNFESTKYRRAYPYRSHKQSTTLIIKYWVVWRSH